MKRIAGLLATVATVLLLAACGSGDPGDIPPDRATSLSKAAASASEAIESAESQTSSAGSGPAESSVTATSTDDLAAKLGCASVKPVKKLYASSAAYCTLPNGHEVELAIFPSTAFRDQYLSDAAQIAPEAVSVKGDRWSAGGLDCTDDDLAPLK